MHKRLRWIPAALAAAVLVGSPHLANAGTVNIVTSTQVLSIPGGTWQLNGFTGSVNLTVDGPAVDFQTIYSVPGLFTSSDTTGGFNLPVNLDGVDMNLPVQFNSTNVFANGVLTYTPGSAPGTSVSVQLDSFVKGTSSFLTARFQQQTSGVPEPEGLVLAGAGGLLLAGYRKLRSRRA